MMPAGVDRFKHWMVYFPQFMWVQKTSKNFCGKRFFKRYNKIIAELNDLFTHYAMLNHT